MSPSGVDSGTAGIADGPTCIFITFSNCHLDSGSDLLRSHECPHKCCSPVCRATIQLSAKNMQIPNAGALSVYLKTFRAGTEIGREGKRGGEGDWLVLAEMV